MVLHMLSGIAIDGRFGMTAVGGSAQEATHLFAAVRPAVDRLCPSGLIARRLRRAPPSPGSFGFRGRGPDQTSSRARN